MVLHIEIYPGLDSAVYRPSNDISTVLVHHLIERFSSTFEGPPLEAKDRLSCIRPYQFTPSVDLNPRCLYGQLQWQPLVCAGCPPKPPQHVSSDHSRTRAGSLRSVAKHKTHTEAIIRHGSLQIDPADLFSICFGPPNGDSP